MPIPDDRGSGVTAKNLWRGSIIVFAMVVLTAYAAALTLTVLFSAPPLGQGSGQIILAGTLFLAVIVLGFVLWRDAESQSGA